MSELGRDCREGTEEVMQYARQWEGSRVTSCFPAWTMVRDNSGGAGCTELQVPVCHPRGLVQCGAVGYLGLRLRRSDWLEPESWGGNLLIMGMVAMEVMVNPLVPPGLVSSSS